MNFSAFFAGKRRYMRMPAVKRLLVPHTKKIGCLMRLSLFSMALLIGTMNILFARDANGQDLNEIRLRLEVKNEPLIKTLKKIQKQTPFSFAYNKKDLAGIAAVNLPAGLRTVKETLDLLFAHTQLQYEQIGGNIVISVKPVEHDVVKLDLGNMILQDIPEKDITITGIVKNDKGQPLAGVSVLVHNTQNGTLTNAEGKFKITLSENSGNKITLDFSYVGFEPQSRELNPGEGPLDIVLKESQIGLNEVVVVGYGTQKKADITAAIASVKAKDFVQGPANDAAALIRGKVPGLSIVNPDANPTGVSQINLRGITTLKAGISPLVIIDGVPGTLTTIAPEDIESIDVLKDGSAAAIYGTRGTNGVILITTKKVNGETPPTVDINTYFTTQIITKKLNFMNAEQYRRLVAENKPGAIDYGGNTNWFDEVSQTPFSQVYNISLKGGSKNTNYIANLNYRNLQGIMKKSDNKVLFPRLEINHSMFNGKIRLNANINGYQQEYYLGSDYLSTDVIRQTYNPQVYRNALTYNPTDHIKDSAGNWTEHVEKTDYKNPVSLLKETLGLTQNSDFRTSGTIVIQPIKEVTVSILGSRDLFNSTRGYYETKKHYSTVHDGKNGYASRGAIRTVENLLEATAQYSKTIDKHKFTVLGGYSWRTNNYQDYYMQNWDFPTDAFSYDNMGAGQALARGQAVEYSYQSDNKLIGYFGRLNYNFMNRYMLMASIRREGSSKFGEDHKWGNFPAVSVGWNLQEEQFMRSIAFLSTLKLRAGYGVTGTEPSDPYMSLDKLNFNNYGLINGVWSPVITPSSNPNPDLRWEKKREINIGLDFGLFNNGIWGSIDVYKRTTKDLLMDYTVPTPPYLYNTITANAASMENKGIEIQVNANPFATKVFQWTTSVNFSANQNKLITLSNDKFQLASGFFDAGNTGEPIQQPTHRVQVGQPIGNFYGFKSVDIDNNGRWIIEGKDGKPKPISEQTADDKQIIGNGLPKRFLSWNNTLSYKSFDLNITMRGAFGYQILNTQRMFFDVPVMLTRGNLLATAYDKVYNKRPLADDQELQYVSYFIEKGNYWKIDNITLGYNVRVQNTALIKYVKRIRLYLAASNLKAFTGYKGIDPEISIYAAGLAPGVDDKNRYPSTASYTIGASLTF